VESVVADLDLEIPEGLLDAEIEARAHNLAHRLEEDELTFADYFQITGQDQDSFLAELREQARSALATRILLEGIVKIESLEVSDDDYDEAVGALAARSGAEAGEIATALEESGQEASLAGDILRAKALERLVASATPVDESGDPVDLTPIVPIEGPAADDDNDEDDNATDSEERGETAPPDAAGGGEVEPAADQAADPAETEE
jgi:trigger factor